MWSVGVTIEDQCDEVLEWRPWTCRWQKHLGKGQVNVDVEESGTALWEVQWLTLSTVTVFAKVTKKLPVDIFHLYLFGLPSCISYCWPFFSLKKWSSFTLFFCVFLLALLLRFPFFFFLETHSSVWGSVSISFYRLFEWSCPLPCFCHRFSSPQCSSGPCTSIYMITNCTDLVGYSARPHHFNSACPQMSTSWCCETCVSLWVTGNGTITPLVRQARKLGFLFNSSLSLPPHIKAVMPCL